MTGPDFLIIGHITQDLTPLGPRLGGSAAYAALAGLRLGARPAVVTSARPDLDLGLLKGVVMHLVPSPATTTFENRYHDRHREQFLYARASSLLPSHIPSPWRACPVVLLGPVADEVSPQIAGLFPGSLVGATPQGWLRRAGPDGKVGWQPWTAAAQILAHTQVLILSPDDLPSRDEAEQYARQVPVLILTLGEEGARGHWAGEWHAIAPFPAERRDPTGAGDAFAAAFLLHYARHHDPAAAGRFASCYASLLVARGGPEGLPTLKELEQHLNPLLF